MGGEPSVNDTGPDPLAPKSATRRSTCAGTASRITMESVSAGVAAGLVTMIWYSTIAPGIALGATVPLAGSECTMLSLTTVSGTVLLLVHVQVTEAGGMVIVRLNPLPAVPTVRSEEQTSELQSLMRTSYAVFC